MVEIMNEEYEHPAFPQPADRNATIWRYQEFDRFKSLVETGWLYMRRADLFDKDQFEGTTPKGEIDYWKQFADKCSDTGSVRPSNTIGLSSRVTGWLYMRRADLFAKDQF